MSKLLIDERPLTVLPSLVKLVGIERAIILQQIHWLSQQRNTGVILDDGEKWIWGNYADLCEEFFPFWHPDSLKKHINRLVKDEYVFTQQPKGFDRTNYYRINYKKFDLDEANQDAPMREQAPSSIGEDIPSSIRERVPSSNREDVPLSIGTDVTQSNGEHLTQSKGEEVPPSIYRTEMSTKTSTKTSTKKGIVGVPPTTPAHPDSWDEFLGVFCWTCYGHMQIHKLTEKQRGALTSEAKMVYADGYTRADLKSWFADQWKIKICYRNDKQLPQPHEIRSSIPILRDQTNKYAGYAPLGEAYTAPPAEEHDDSPQPAPKPTQPAAPKTTWEICLDEIKLAMGDYAYEQLQGSRLVEADMVETKNEKGEKALMPLYQIHLPDPVAVDWLKNRALGSIRRTLSIMLHQTIMLEIVADVPEAA